MSRRRRKRVKSIVKFTVLLFTPIISVSVFKSIPEFLNILNKADSIMLKNENAGNLKQRKSEELSYNLHYNEDYEDVFNEDFDLSVGFGFEEETADEKTNKSPYETVSENPGEKPYPTEWSEGGSIVRNTYGEFTGNNYFNLEKAGQVNNKTSVSISELQNESKLLPEFKISLNLSEPQVLIYHTHTTESFEPFVRDFYDASFNYRTTDETKNMVMVGNEIQKQLEDAGIGVIHDTTIHDYPSYNGAYDRSAVTIQNALDKYPSIKVILDIHRDAICSEGIAYQPFVEIDGKEAAQIMIISGCDDGTLNMPNYMQNFRLASLFQQQIETDYPGLTRPILFDYRKYNQNMSTGALLFEMGSHGNTLEQVQYSGELVGKSIARALISIKEQL